jgi:eukaryotic-like serine/threonine-protein kinase
MESTKLESIGPYRLESLLGKGGMGVVYLATDTRDETQVALKTLPHAGRQNFRAMRREIKALKRLRHPHIVRIFDDGRLADGTPWYTMEFLVGTPLDEIIDKQAQREAFIETADGKPGLQPSDVRRPTWTSGLPHAQHPLQAHPDSVDVSGETRIGYVYRSAELMSVPAFEAISKPANPNAGFLAGGMKQLLTCATEISHALAYLHGEGIVHCDLKPQNIVVTDDGRSVLVDFGLAASRGKGTEATEIEDAGVTAGTVSYLAPERIKGNDFDSRLDLYAVGCILYETVTKRPLFMHAMTSVVLAAHLGQKAPRLDEHHEDTPREFADLVEGLLEKNPENRPSNALAVYSALRTISGLPVDSSLPQPRPHLYATELVGRKELLESCVERVRRAATGRVVTAMIRGESGV